MPAGIVAASHGYGQRDNESRALPFPGTLDANRPSMQLGQMFDDGQSETQAAVTARDRGIGLPEPVEYKGQELRFDADPAVFDRDFKMRVHPLENDIDAAGRRCELDCVGE